MVQTETLNSIIADLVWWFGLNLNDLDRMKITEVNDWLKQANRQKKAGYTRL
ncbi:GpE family phage tail protein [Glaesserella parasuis]|nr:GpE family phage tail protein [Glaesserella parasuis]